ncbi:MAG: hypothetical protein LBO20_03400 [Bifidobacteriaceae bacterium]|jgi:hypothetical protein|nr:hypothetical protein [Bifidobacteriaceae bacterium]
MTDSLGSFFAPGMAHLDREKERQRNDTHQVTVDAPPWDAMLDAGVIAIDVPSGGQPPAADADSPALEADPAD